LYSAWRTVVIRGSGSEAGVRVGRNGEGMSLLYRYLRHLEQISVDFI